MLRKRRQPAPYFRVAGSPFNPATGERAPIGRGPQRGTTLALFQVIGDPPHEAEDADTHDNYVVCRGYEVDHDPQFRYLHDPYTKPATTPIHVAKPYSVRGTFPYQLGQVIVAARILHRLGHNVGKAETTTGQPADLDEEVVILTDDDDVGIAWIDISQAPSDPTFPAMLETATAQSITANTNVAPFGHERGDFSAHGFTVNLTDGSLTYAGEDRWFMHHTVATVRPTAGNDTGSYVSGTVQPAPTNILLAGQGHFYWPGGRRTEGGIPAPVLAISIWDQQVSCLIPWQALDGHVYKLHAIHEGFDYIVQNAYWSVTPLE